MYYYLLTHTFLFNRCDTLNFKISKSQKKVIKRVTRFLRSGECNTKLCGTEQTEQTIFINNESHSNLCHFLIQVLCKTYTNNSYLYI